MNRQAFLLPLLLLLCFAGQAQVKTDTLLKHLLQQKGNGLLQRVLARPDSFQYQVIYTRIDRNLKNVPAFTHYFLNVDRNRYFNPASTVKLPTALAALEKLNDLKIKGLDRYTPMITDSAYSGQTPVHRDTSSPDGHPSVAHYIRKIFIVSDNDAYNRLYEFVGQQTLNETLRGKGYGDVRITRRFVPMTPEENRHTNPLFFIENGDTVYKQPAAYSSIKFHIPGKIFVGHAHLDRRDSLVHAPMEFTTHNNFPLEDLHKMVQSVIFPQSVPQQQRFRLTGDDLKFLYHYMSLLPYQSPYPAYDTTEFFDSYAKFFFKSGKREVPPHIRIFNKPGWSYGFLTDAAYVQDLQTGIEFMLSAVIYVNADGVLNDNRYEYESIGYPFFGELFRVIYEAERERRKRGN
jgi:hypothetical protein